MKYALMLVLAFAAQMSMAQTIKCADIGELYPDGDQMFIAYNDKLGFSDKNDVAYLVHVGADSVDYRASKWGALLTIPKALLNSKTTATVGILQPETAYEAVTCSAE